MAIRIPTGLKTVSTTVARKNLIAFRCTKCGNTHLREMPIKATQTSQYHIFGGDKARQTAETTAYNAAVNALETLDRELFYAINVQQDYNKIADPVICPTCGEKQIWSNIPKTMKELHDTELWVFGVIISGFISFFTFVLAGFFGLIPLAFFLWLLSIPFIQKRKKKKALDALRNASFQPPKYYNRSNAHELRNG